MEEFCSKLADILEVDELTGSDILADYPEWDSLSVLSAIAMIDSRYGVNLTAADLKGIDTAEALFNLIQSKNGN